MATGLDTERIYVECGYSYDEQRGAMLFDLSVPRTIEVTGIHSLTGKTKTYILKVTEKGICLV